jgi:hypothetical protein
VPVAGQIVAPGLERRGERGAERLEQGFGGPARTDVGAVQRERATCGSRSSGRPVTAGKAST